MLQYKVFLNVLKNRKTHVSSVISIPLQETTSILLDRFLSNSLWETYITLCEVIWFWFRLLTHVNCFIFLVFDSFDETDLL